MNERPFYSLLFLFAFIILSAACDQNANSDADSGEDSVPIIPVETMDVTRGDISAYYTNTATLEAVEEADVVAKVRGQITKVLAEEGDVVTKGQILARVEDAQYRIEAERAKATLDRLYNEYQRNQELFERELISAEVFENSRYEYESQKAAYELAELNYEHTAIRAPIDGVVTQRMIKTGNMIGMDQQAFRVSDFDPIQAILFVPEHERSKIQKGQKAILSADALPGYEFQGKVERISPTVDPATGTFRVTVFLNDELDMLRPGMFGRIKITYDTRLNTRMIPKAAVINEDESQSVFVVRDSLAFRKKIRTGYANGVNIEILEGLEDGELVVTTGQGSLSDSTKVNVVSI